MQQEDDAAIVEVYKAYLGDVNDLRASRQNENSIRVTVATLFLGGQAFIGSLLLSNPKNVKLTDPDFSSWVPFLAIAIIGFIAIRFCHNWRRLVTDLTTSISQKFTNLREMEEGSKLLQRAGATLFIEEYKKRHPEYVPPAAPAPAAPAPAAPAPAAPTARRRPRIMPVGGAGLSAINLSEFFLATFERVSWAAIIIKGTAVFVSLIVASGILQTASHILPR